MKKAKKLIKSTFYHLFFYKTFKIKAKGLHLGCGNHKIDGFLNIDSDMNSACDILGKVDRLKLDSNSVDVIYNCHVLEHIPKNRVRKTLHRWHRVLKPGGKIYISLPNLENVCKLYLNNIDKESLNQQEWEKICTITNIIYGGQNTKYDFHNDGYSFITLKYWLEEIGFKDIKEFAPKALSFKNFSDSSEYHMDNLPISLNVEATK